MITLRKDYSDFQTQNDLLSNSGRHILAEMKEEFLKPMPSTKYQLHPGMLELNPLLQQKYDAKPSGDIEILYEDLPILYEDLQFIFKERL